MPVYGNYETVGNPYAETQGRSHIATIWLARQADQAAAATFAIKLFSQKNKIAEVSDTLGADHGLEFIKLLKQQKRCAEGQRNLFIPIHEIGPTPDGFWYATDYYARGSLKNWITLRGNLDSAALRNVVASTLAGCLQLQTAAGRSHGNLKPANIFLGGKAQPLGTTPLFLADPLPIATESFEARDLRGIGELVLQLVVGRIYQSAADYNYPVADSRAWSDLGKDADYWRDLCNRLLDPNLSLSNVNFESLARQFPLAKPSRLPWVMISTIASMCIAIGAFGVYLHGSRPKLADADNQPLIPIKKSPTTRTTPPPTSSPTAPISSLQPKQSEADFSYTNELEAANAALATNNFTAAIDHASKVLDFRPADAVALQVKNDALSAQTKVRQQTENDLAFTNALNAAQTAFISKDYTTAASLAQRALDKRQDNPRAQQIMKDALAYQSAYDAKAKADSNYNTAMSAAQAALNDRNYSVAIDQANSALTFRKGDTAAKQLIDNATSQQQTAITASVQYQTDQAYTNAVTAAQSALDQKDYPKAIVNAETALNLRIGDDVALQIKVKAQRQQKADADAQKALQKQAAYDQAYTNALTMAQADLNKKDYTNAITHANEGLVIRPQATEPVDLIKQATSRQQAELAAAQAAMLQQQKDQAYTNALTAAQTALNDKDYATALTWAQQALDKRPEDPVASQLKVRAETQQSIALAVAKANMDFTNAVISAQAALGQKDYRTAMAQIAIALKIRPEQASVLQLQRDVLTQQQVAQVELDQNYTNALTAAQNALAKKDYSKADAEAKKALLMRPDDEQVRQLRNNIDIEIKADNKFTELKQKAVEAIQAGNFTNALILYQQARNLRPSDHEIDTAILSITPKANDQMNATKELQTHDHQLQVLMRHFGISAKKNGQITPDSQEAEYSITIDQSVVEKEGNDRNELEKWYKSKGLLLDERKADLDAIKTKINNWGN